MAGSESSPQVLSRFYQRAEWVHLCDRMICYLLMMEVIILPLNHRKFLHSLAIGLLASLWISKMILLKKWIWRRTPIDLPIALFLVWGVFSAILSTHPRYSIGDLRTEAVTYFFFFYVVVTHIREKKDIRRVLLSLIAGSALMASYGIYEFLVGGGNWTSRATRIGALTSDFNYASTYFMMVIPVILYFIVDFSKKPLQRSVFFILLFMNLLALYFTFTRAAWLGLVVSLVVLSLYRGKRAILATAFGVGMLLILLFGTSYGRGFYTNMGGSEGGRTPTWKFGMKEIIKRPVFGIGYGRKNMEATFPEEKEMIKNGFMHLHNVFLETTLEMGIIGGMFLVVLIVSSVLHFTKGFLRSTDPSDAWLMVVMVMIIVAYFTRNQFDHIYVDAPAVLFWLLMGLGMSRLQTPSQRGLPLPEG